MYNAGRISYKLLLYGHWFIECNSLFYENIKNMLLIGFSVIFEGQNSHARWYIRVHSLHLL